MRWLNFLVLSLVIFGLSSINSAVASTEEKLPQSKLVMGFPNPLEIREVCRYVKSKGPSIFPELIANGILDANNDGQDEKVTVTQIGAHLSGDVLEYRPIGASDESAPIDYTSWEDRGPSGARWLKHKGRIYTIYFETQQFDNLLSLGYIDPTNNEHLICNFWKPLKRH